MRREQGSEINASTLRSLFYESSLVRGNDRSRKWGNLFSYLGLSESSVHYFRGHGAFSFVA